MSDKIRVLMVDDEAQFRATTRKILNRKGFDTRLAASGEEALEKLHENPDVVILDIKMPGMDGHQVLREIKIRYPDLPVIMLTGHGALPSAMEALDQGAFDYLSKPCDVNLLAARIKDAYLMGKGSKEVKEKRVKGVMVPINEYTTLSKEQSIQEAVFELKKTFTTKISTSRLMETGHRSILVMGAGEEVIGILTIKDLLKMIMPAYLYGAKPSTADSIQYSPMFWSGMFTESVKKTAQKKIGDVMSPAPPTIDGEANLMEAAYMMVERHTRHLTVMLSARVAGVIREQDLFFEIARILCKY
ncbi:MAG: response regulator [Deltaproteobacteria bacterium]|nr:response regulator [Deltaproteobacteria bacterium]MBW1960047.1 response regulator [Deltaproteobacteria bacterium]MBW2151239.1 response regulator [Deltaproteobacteria bacterium]